MYFSILCKILLIIIFCMSIFLYMTDRLLPIIDGFDNNNNNDNNKCPDLLIQNGEQFYLYNSKAPTIKGSNPIIFSKLSDYGDFISKNPNCPVLFLQKSSNTQGNDVYNVRGGTPMNSWNYNGIGQTPPLANGNNNIRIVPFVDSILQNPPYNSYNTPGYAGFDPRGFDVGRFNPLDAIHISGELLPISDSPTDPNWGGIKYTAEQVNSGKYINNEVYRPNLSGGSNVTIA